MVDFSKLKYAFEFKNNEGFNAWFCKKIEIWKDTPSPHISLWYAIYEKFSEIEHNL